MHRFPLSPQSPPYFPLISKSKRRKERCALEIERLHPYSRRCPFSTLLRAYSEHNLVVNAIILALSFAIILVGSELFTNGVEWAGHRLHIAEAAVGSVLAAVGTALPETFIPAVALLTGRDSAAAHGVLEDLPDE